MGYSESRPRRAEKASELYKLCDVVDKGFITKFDMHSLLNHLLQSPEQLEEVFDFLYTDGNGLGGAHGASQRVALSNPSLLEEHVSSQKHHTSESNTLACFKTEKKQT